MKRKATWDKLKDQMGDKRNRNETRKNTKGSSSPHEIIVQRLASEPDNKQTFKAIQPREFVSLESNEFSLANLKKSCADHFHLPTATCDILVTNKGPSCTNIAQIPHRRDKVYLVRFVVAKEQVSAEVNRSSSDEESDLMPAFSAAASNVPSHLPSVSIASLLEAGKLVQPSPKRKSVLTLEKFDVATQEWITLPDKEMRIDTKKFSSGAFRDAFHAVDVKSNDNWVLKTYNDHTVKTIKETIKSTLESHCRKQVQMHGVARHLTNIFASKVPTEFGECFSYNKCYYTYCEDKPATIEEFVPGSFVKLINNDGSVQEPSGSLTKEQKKMHDKAQCLVHFTYQYSDQKLMVTDIQGSGYGLYDPEIASTDLQDFETSEFYFCCGNCCTVGIQKFIELHVCNEFCKLMGLNKLSLKSK